MPPGTPHHNAPGATLSSTALEGAVTMYEDGMRKSLAGITTFEEVLRVTRED